MSRSGSTNIIENFIMNQSIDPILNSFEPITLAELDAVRLLDRIDTKYIFNIDRLPEILKSLRFGYKILEIEMLRESSYQTIYFDTDQFLMYHQHQRGKLSRVKVRMRRYCDSGLSYFEIKHKTNAGRTIKRRVKNPEFSMEIIGESKELLEKRTSLVTEQLHPKLWVNYNRLTFASKDLMTRLTVDLGLTFSDGQNQKSFERLVIAELKQSNHEHSDFQSLMQMNGINDISISKYCLGITQLYDGVKKNNFKRKIISIQKILRNDN
ncbi:MAG: polyphosphate polymerase domain-containing protein [Bacteroidota bacterium]